MPLGASGAGTEHVHVSPIPAHASGVARIPSTMFDQWALARIQRTVASAPIRFELWDGFELDSVAGPRAGTIRFKNRRALFGWVWDREMVYTCAYFPTPGATLEDAQVAKMDLVCRKLCLKPGDRVIEAGCGWGSLALFMARHYGVSVRAFNISSEQIAHARRRAKDEGLTDRVEFVEDDYRNVRGKGDVFVSVGMLEHVGAPDYPTFGRVIDRSLSENGRGLLHFIGRNQPAPLNAWIRKRIFPGAYAPTLREVFGHVLEPHAFSVLDVENLRLHYAKTLEHWLQRFSQSARHVSAMFDETFVRAWELYLAGSEAAFTTGSLQLFQVVFARGDSNVIPWTRVSG